MGWSPLLLIAGSPTEHGTLEAFAAQVEKAPLTVSADRSSVSFGWRGHTFEFIPGPSTWQGNWSLPTIDGKPIDIDPPFVYSSPHMSAKLDSDVVTAGYGDYQLRYD